MMNFFEIYKKDEKDGKKEEKSNQCEIYLGLKIINQIADVKNIKKDG